MTAESVISRWPFALVHLNAKDGTQSVVQAACAVFDTPDRFAFVHPGYIDPYNANNRLHRVVCTSVAVGSDSNGPWFDGLEWAGRIERHTGNDAQRERVGEVFDWYPTVLLERQGRTVDAERAWLRETLAKDLA